MEERDEKTGTDPEIEAPAEGDDLEAHKRIKLKATDEGPDEDSDDVELHRTTTTTTTTTT